MKSYKARVTDQAFADLNAIYEYIDQELLKPDKPKTGDDNNLGFWWTMLISSFMGLFGAGMGRLKRRKKYLKK